VTAQPDVNSRVFAAIAGFHLGPDYDIRDCILDGLAGSISQMGDIRPLAKVIRIKSSVIWSHFSTLFTFEFHK